MADIFLKFINMGISASWLVLVVIILRLLLKKAPKWLNPVLWGIVGLRLVLPFTIESTLSLIPSAQTISPEIMYAQEPTIHSGFPALNSMVNPIITESFAPNPADSANPLQIWIAIAALVWSVGIAAMLIYTVISYLHLSRRVKTAVLLRDHIYQSENVASPFVLGILRPRIYLPFNMDEKDSAHVIAHEQTHIKRRDHWIKPFGFLLLALYWFNPVLWVAYILLCRDIELACDEKVIKELHVNQRADYSDALLSCSVQRRMIAACPLAFGEVGVKERVKNVLNYKKPAFWLIVVAVVASIGVAVCFLTNPKKAPISFGTIQLTWANALDMRPDEPTSYNLSEAELGELQDRLRDLEIGRKNNEYGGFTPMFSLSIKAQGMGQFVIASYNSEGTYVGLMVAGEYYRIEDDDFSKYLSTICAGGNRAEVPGNGDRLSLDDVIALSQKGNELTWQDFDGSAYVLGITGMYIRIYEIDGTFSLMLAGSLDDEKPMHIHLSTKAGQGDFVDIRTGDVAAFIREHSGAEEPDLTFEAAYIRVNYSDDGYYKMFQSSLNPDTIAISSAQHLPIVRLESRDEFDSFYTRMDPYFTFDQGWDESPSFSAQAASYDDAFFETNSLFVIYSTETSSSNRHMIEGVWIKNGTFAVGVNRLAPEIGDTAMAGWFITLAVPKAALKECTSFDAYIYRA